MIIILKHIFKIIFLSVFFIYPLYSQQCSDINGNSPIINSFECTGDFILNQNDDLIFSSSWGDSTGIVNGNFIINNTSNIFIKNNYTLKIKENLHLNSSTSIFVSANSLLEIEKDFILLAPGDVPVVLTLNIEDNSYLQINGDLILTNNTSLLLNNENTNNQLMINGSIINNAGKLSISKDVYLLTSYIQNDGYIIFDVDSLSYLHSSDDIIITSGIIGFKSSNINTYEYLNHYEYMFFQSDSGNIDINADNVNMEFIIYDANSGKETVITTLPPHLKLTYKLITNEDGSVSLVAVIDRVDDIPGTEDNNVSPNNPYNNEETLAIEELFNQFINNTKPIPPSLSNVLLALDLLAGNNASGETDRDTLLRFYDSLKPINNNTIMQHTKEISENINDAIFNILKNPIDNVWVNVNLTDSTLQNIDATEGYASYTSLLQIGFSLYNKKNYHFLGSLNYSNGKIYGNNNYYKLKDISSGLSLGFSYYLLNNTSIDYVFTYQDINYNGNRYLIDNTLSTSVNTNQSFTKNTIQLSYTYNTLVDINPYIQFSYNYISGDSYSESGDGMVNVDKFTSAIYTPNIGLNLLYKDDFRDDILINTKVNLSIFKDFYNAVDTNYYFIGVEDTQFNVENIDYNNIYYMASINISLKTEKKHLYQLTYGYKSNHKDYKNNNISLLFSFKI